MSYYQWRPLLVEADQFFVDSLPWPEGIEEVSPESGVRKFQLKLHRGYTEILPGEWVIKSKKGLLRYTDELFNRMLEIPLATELTRKLGEIWAAIDGLSGRIQSLESRMTSVEAAVPAHQSRCKNYKEHHP